MVTFPTPQKIGIGITRGSACCIHTDDEILDYSGRTLNLASRLMEMARPSGIVLDSGFGVGLLSKETRELFSEEMVFVRGIAEEEPIKVYCTKKYTIIPKVFKKPLKEPKWDTVTYDLSLRELKRITGNLRLRLKKKPFDKNKIIVKVRYANPKLKGWTRIQDLSDDFKYTYEGGENYVIKLSRQGVSEFIETLEEDGMTSRMRMGIEIAYPMA